MIIRLFDWGPSPFCIKIRTLLDYKGVRYERVPVLGAALFELRRRSPVGKVPALEIDGQLVVDSTDIAYEIERLFPTPAVLPLDPRQRALAHALEDWADEALYFVGLYFQWQDREGAPLVARAFGSGPLGTLALAFYRRRIRSQLRGQGTGRKTPELVEADLRRQLAAIDALLATGTFLLGEAPMLCDFAVGAQLVYLSRPPRSARVLAEYPRLADYLESMKALRRSGARVPASR